MSNIGPPPRHRTPRATEYTLARAGGEVLVVLAAIGLLWNPILTVAVVLASVLGVVVAEVLARTLRPRLDGLSRSVRFPGLGTLDVRFSTQ